MSGTPEILIPALRQYCYNTGIGFVFGFDYNETVKIIIEQQTKISELQLWKSEAEKQMIEYGKLATHAAELQAVVDRLAKWSRDNPRGRIYPAGKRQKDMDGELIEIEELAKQHTSEENK